MRACAACEMKMACGADRGQHGEDTSSLHPHTHTIFISSHFQSSEPIEASDFQFQTYLIYFIYTHTTHTSVDFRGYARRISNHDTPNRRPNRRRGRDMLRRHFHASSQVDLTMQKQSPQIVVTANSLVSGKNHRRGPTEPPRRQAD